jgi:hypothetical protein
MLRAAGRALAGEAWAPGTQAPWTHDFYFVQVGGDETMLERIV